MQAIPLNKLVPSKSNVRRVAATGIEGLAENIFACGLLQNLSVTPGEGDTFEVVAGGRRLAAMKLLAKSKRWEADMPINCEVVDAAAAQEISLSENAMREAMHPADQFEAFKQLADSGFGDDTIAARFGVTAAVVRQRLKLAVVSPKLMALYRKGEMGLEHLMAFTLTDDHKRQEAVWKRLEDWDRRNVGQGARTIRNALTENMLDASRSKLAKFVGLKAYEKAGGEVLRDLFGGEEAGYLTDAALLQKLADEKLQKHIDKALKEGWKWAEVLAEGDYQTEQRMGRITATPTPEQAERLAAIQARLQEISDLDPDGLDDDEQDAFYEEQQKLQDEESEIEAAAVFSAEDKARAGVLVSIGHDGKVQISAGLIKPEDQKAQKAAAKAVAGAEVVTKPEQPKSLSAGLLEALTAHKTAALQAKLASNPKVALAAVVHALIVSTVRGAGGSSCLQITGQTSYLKSSAADIADNVAVDELMKRTKAVQKGVPADGDKLFDWLLKQDQRKLLDILAVCAAQTVDVIEKKFGDKSKLLHGSHLADALKLDMADYWEPTAANYLGRVSKEQILEAVKDACGTDGTVEIAGLKKGEAAKRAETLMAGKRWLPQVLKAGG